MLNIVYICYILNIVSVVFYYINIGIRLVNSDSIWVLFIKVLLIKVISPFYCLFCLFVILVFIVFDICDKEYIHNWSIHVNFVKVILCNLRRLICSELFNIVLLYFISYCIYSRIFVFYTHINTFCLHLLYSLISISN